MPSFRCLISRDEFALVGRNGAESTTSKTSSMQTDRELNHFVGRNTLPFVFRMGQPGIRQVKRSIQLFCRHGRIGGIDHHIFPIHTLYQSLGVHHIRLFLHIPEILGLGALVAQAFLVTVQHDVLLCYSSGDILLTRQVYSLRHIPNVTDFLSLRAITMVVFSPMP